MDTPVSKEHGVKLMAQQVSWPNIPVAYYGKLSRNIRDGRTAVPVASWKMAAPVEMDEPP